MDMDRTLKEFVTQYQENIRNPGAVRWQRYPLQHCALPGFNSDHWISLDLSASQRSPDKELAIFRERGKHRPFPHSPSAKVKVFCFLTPNESRSLDIIFPEKHSVRTFKRLFFHWNLAHNMWKCGSWSLWPDKSRKPIRHLLDPQTKCLACVFFQLQLSYENTNTQHDFCSYSRSL